MKNLYVKVLKVGELFSKNLIVFFAILECSLTCLASEAFEQKVLYTFEYAINADDISEVESKVKNLIDDYPQVEQLNKMLEFLIFDIKEDTFRPKTYMFSEVKSHIGKLLLEAGADVLSLPAHAICISSNDSCELTAALIAHGGYFRIKEYEGELLYRIAVKRYKVEPELNGELVILTALKYGANPNTSRQGQPTPLWLAIKNEHYNIAKALIQHGANPDIIEPLHQKKTSYNTSRKLIIKMMADTKAESLRNLYNLLKNNPTPAF
jgi:hypothetical protein